MEGTREAQSPAPEVGYTCTSVTLTISGFVTVLNCISIVGRDSREWKGKGFSWLRFFDKVVRFPFSPGKEKQRSMATSSQKVERKRKHNYHRKSASRPPLLL